MKKIILTLLIALPLGLSAQNPAFLTDVDGQLETLEQRMEFHKVNGASVAIFRNFELDTTFQLGVREQETSLPVDESTIFQFGSMTGAVLRFAVVKLASAGIIDLDQPANEYLSSWQIEEKGFTRREPITVRDLILERRGFNPVYKPNGYLPGEELPTWEQIMDGESPSNVEGLQLKKSQAKNSSFANEMILQRLLEDVHGKPLAEILEEEVFTPIGMTHSMIRAELSEEEAVNAAVGYDEELGLIEGKRRIYPEIAHSGLWSTPEDFGKFVLHIYQAAKGNDNSLISQELAIQGITPQDDYHCLILLSNNGNYWGGAPKGFYNQFAANFEEGWIVVGCSNRELAWQFIQWELNGRSIEYARR